MADSPISQTNNREKTERKCSLSSEEPLQVIMSTVFIENSDKTNVGGLQFPEKSPNIPPSLVMEENFAITINGPTTLETNGRDPNITIANYGPVIHFSDEMMHLFQKEGSLVM